MKTAYLFLFSLFFLAFTTGEEKLRIFLVGDSTMANKLPFDAPETGWGMILPQYFSEGVEVQNHAVNGRSTKSFRAEGRWAKILEQMRPGDWVLIQFGHNDSKNTDTTRYAAAQTDYRKNLTRYIEETRAKGGNVILLTPVMRRKFDENGKFIDTHGEYPQVVKEVAQAMKAPLIDVHAKSREVIEQAGVEGSKRLFMHLPGKMHPKFPEGKVDDTHFSGHGASIMASLVAEGIRDIGNPLLGLLKPSRFTDKLEFELPKIAAPFFRKDTFSIVRYGAKSDGITLSTPAINQAVNLAHEAGGGVVVVPSGFWLTGPIVLKSNVNLHISQGALLQFSNKREDFPLVKTTWEGEDAIRCQAPISAVEASNIAITGTGIIDGAGQVWRQVKKDKLTEAQWKKLIASGGVLDEEKRTWYPSENALKGSKIQKPGSIAAGFNLNNCSEFKDFLRPNMVSLSRCTQVLLEGITFQNSPAWTIHPLLCEHITLRDVIVRNPWYGQNNDALDLESCRNGLVEGCSFDTGDDGICIKSGRDAEGRKRGVPTENIIVRNCTVFHGHGGFVIGSEMSGGVRNLFVSDCNFLGTDVGLRFKTARGRGGIVENIYVTDINMTNIPGEAILFDMYYMAKDPVSLNGEKNVLPEMKAEPLGEGTPQFRNFHIKNIVCQGAETGILIRGLPEMPIKNISIENANITCNQGLVCVESENIRLKNIGLFTQEKRVMQVQNSQKVTLDGIRYQGPVDLLLHISGKRSAEVSLLNTDAKQAKKEVEMGAEVSRKVFKRK
ncbi:glycosyl hydrolase family 28 protein [Haliscomenobacter hydrossis]|uniref:Polygalacturonase n=1 Tax=Haliscomenobacter hydrossis (strain ATCC 27775 / DSM 1100 / LMG 10767 / O) TaxID=760192 RepID=F4KQU4_HALH1|nr:glycosyl hydrolase family 28 protein [Haliscomenobacter hydrossis]AEE52229.1 Polygalacturonase [Haliscomenobacter hydrossis DSM 1100]